MIDWQPMRRSRASLPPRSDAWAPPVPARPPLTRDDVVRAAINVLDEVGLDGLTMRRLADRLGLRSASLYWHVRDKDELLSLIADAICAEIEPPSSDQPWIAQLEAMAWEYRRVLLTHRDAALVLANTLPNGPNRLRLAERMLALLVQAGFSPSVAANAGLLFLDFATNAVIEEGRSQAMTAAFGTHTEGAEVGDFQQWFASLSAEQYPTLVALAADLTGTDAETRFRFGIEVLVSGLLAQKGQGSRTRGD
jgi:TetR/AcrR family transcriptional regulator, tetracycline repressor protein